MERDESEPTAGRGHGASPDEARDERAAPVTETDAALVAAARAGDDRAFGRLFDRWFDSVHDIAWRIVRDRDQAAEVAQDVFLVAWQGLGTLEQPGSFGGWVRRIARNRALNRLDRERRSMPDSEAAAAVLDRDAPDVDMTTALGEQERRELVWAAAAALGERDASLLDLHLRHGMGAPEIAVELGVTPNNAHQLLHRLKGKLGGAIRAWVLWRGGGSPCEGLDRAVADAGLTTFGPEAVRVVDRHAEHCATCDERRTLRLAPEALFAAVPIGVAPPMLKAEVAGALAEAGVPMAGSSAMGTAADVDGFGGASDRASSGDVASDASADPSIDPAAEPSPGEPVAEPSSASSAESWPSTGPTPEPTSEPVSSPDPVDPSDALAVTPPNGSGAPLSHAAGPPPLAAAGPGDGEGDGGDARAGRPRRVGVLVGLVVLVVLAGVALLLSGGDDPDEVATSDTTPTTEAATSASTAAPSTTEVAVAAPAETAPADTTVTSVDEPAGTTATTPAPAAPPPSSDPTSDPAPEPDPDPAEPTPPAPTIGGFRATRAGTSCNVTLVWQSTGADTASITEVGGGLQASGTHTACLRGPSFTLTVTGPGGSTSQVATLP